MTPKKIKDGLKYDINKYIIIVTKININSAEKGKVSPDLKIDCAHSKCEQRKFHLFLFSQFLYYSFIS